MIQTNCDYETPIPHYTGAVMSKYILVSGSVASRLRSIREHIFSQLAANIIPYWRLKIAIGLYHDPTITCDSSIVFLAAIRCI